MEDCSWKKRAPCQHDEDQVYGLFFCLDVQCHWLGAHPNYLCPTCRGKARPISSRPMTQVDVDITMLDVDATFCYVLLPDFAWPGESSGNSCLSSPPGTAHLRCVTRCTMPASARLCSTAAKHRIWPPLTYSGCVAMTTHQRPWWNLPASILQKVSIEGITTVLCSSRLRLYGHAQRVTSFIKSVTDLAIPDPRRPGRSRKTGPECEKNDVRECGLPGIDSKDRDASRAGGWCNLVLQTPIEWDMDHMVP